MTNDDPMYLRHLEKALEAAELEIKGLEGELREQDKILAEMQEQLAPTRMGEPMIRNCSLTDNMRDDDAARWRWITRAGRTRELRIPAEENKASIDAAIDGKRLMLPFLRRRRALENSGVRHDRDCPGCFGLATHKSNS